MLVLGVSGVAVAGVLADPPQPPKVELLSNAAFMANIAGTGVGGSPGPDPSTAVADEVDVTGITFVNPDKDAKVFAMPDETSEVVAIIPARSEVGATGTTHEGFTQVAYQAKVGWVKDKQLATSRPLSVAPCPSGSGVEEGVLLPTQVLLPLGAASTGSVGRWTS